MILTSANRCSGAAPLLLNGFYCRQVIKTSKPRFASRQELAARGVDLIVKRSGFNRFIIKLHSIKSLNNLWIKSVCYRNLETLHRLSLYCWRDGVRVQQEGQERERRVREGDRGEWRRGGCPAGWGSCHERCITSNMLSSLGLAQHPQSRLLSV